MTKHRLDVRKLFAELLTIVVGVLIALAVGSWWEGVQERAEAASYKERLIAALESDEMEFAKAADRALSVDAAALEVLAVYRGKNVSPDAAEDFAMAVLAASWMPTATVATDTFEDLVSTGNLALLPPEIREALGGYYGRVKVVAEREAIFRARLASGYWQVPPRVLGAELLPTAWSDSASNGDQMLSVSEAELERLVQRLRELPELDPWIADVRHVMTQRVASYSGELTERARALRQVLQALD
jgi:hypothetical protein